MRHLLVGPGFAAACAPEFACETLCEMAARAGTMPEALRMAAVDAGFRAEVVLARNPRHAAALRDAIALAVAIATPDDCVSREAKAYLRAFTRIFALSPDAVLHRNLAAADEGGSVPRPAPEFVHYLHGTAFVAATPVTGRACDDTPFPPVAEDGLATLAPPGYGSILDFVMEESTAAKLRRIRASRAMLHGYGALGMLTGTLEILGVEFRRIGEREVRDQHVVDAINRSMVRGIVYHSMADAGVDEARVKRLFPEKAVEVRDARHLRLFPLRAA